MCYTRKPFPTLSTQAKLIFILCICQVNLVVLAQQLYTINLVEECSDSEVVEISIGEGSGRVRLVDVEQESYPMGFSCQCTLKVRYVGRKRIEAVIRDLNIYNDGRGSEEEPCNFNQDYLLLYEGSYNDPLDRSLTPNGICGAGAADGLWDEEPFYESQSRYLTLVFNSTLNRPQGEAKFHGFTMTYEAYTPLEIVSYYYEQRLVGAILATILILLAISVILLDVVKTNRKKLRNKSVENGPRIPSDSNSQSVNTIPLPVIKISEHM